MESKENEDPVLDLAIYYVLQKTYPATAQLTKYQKRAVRKRAATLLVENGEVYLQKKDTKVKVISSVKEQERILQACHSEATSGHFGVTKTHKRVAERFYWKGMVSDVRELVKHCDRCQHLNKKIEKGRPELNPIPVKSPWYHLGIDFVGPISPPSSAGNRYILTVSDYFTKFSWAHALPTKEASGVVLALRQLFFIVGLPEVITTDQGSEFRNQLNDELTETFGIVHRLTTAYHPQANGLDERYNQTLTNTISKFTEDNHSGWDLKLQEIVYSYNSAVHESSRFSPFEAMFGRLAKLPVDFNTSKDYDAEEKLKTYLSREGSLESDRVAKRVQMENKIKANIKKAQDKQKAYYDKKHCSTSHFVAGDIVLKKDFRRKKRKGGKLDYRWIGPYEILSSLGKGLFRLKEISGKQIVERVNGFHLKRYYEPKLKGTPISESISVTSTVPSDTSSLNLVDDDNPITETSSPDICVTAMSTNTYASVSLNESLMNNISPLPSPLPQLELKNDDLASCSLDGQFSNSISPLPSPFPPLQDSPIHRNDSASCLLDELLCDSISLLPSPLPQHEEELGPQFSSTPIKSSLPTKKSPLQAQTALPEVSAKQPHSVQNIAAKQLMFKARRNLIPEIIDVDAQQPSRKRQQQNVKPRAKRNRRHRVQPKQTSLQNTPKPWITNELYKLTDSDRDLLLHVAGWLNDDIVTASQRLLRQQVSLGNGFQDSCLGMTYSFNIETDEFIQVLFNGYNHWLTISTIEAKPNEVFVYDSARESVSTEVKRQIAAILAAKSSTIKLNFVEVQKQSGGCDCGLFALAFATALVNGVNPGSCRFDQMQMRRHLYQCLIEGRMKMFPLQECMETGVKITSDDTIEVFCTCRMPQINGIGMVECTRCGEWFHLGCVTVPNEVLENTLLPWFCPTCI